LRVERLWGGLNGWDAFGTSKKKQAKYRALGTEGCGAWLKLLAQ